jgi:hypothetical protein
MNLKKSLPKKRFVSLGEREGRIAWYDEYRLQTVLLPPFLSKIKTPYGRRWVLKDSRQSRSADSGVKQESILLVRARTKKQALAESAYYLHWKEIQFVNGKRVSRGYLIAKKGTGNWVKGLAT